MLSTVFNLIVLSSLVCAVEAQSFSVVLATGCDSNSKYVPIDMPGLSSKRTVESSATGCQERCGKVSGCTHFSFWPDGGCHLQDKDATWQQAQGVIAGSRTCAAGCESNLKYFPIDMPGLSPKRTVESSATVCQKRCASTSGCAHFSFWPDGGCHLQDKHATPQSAQRVVAGSLTCHAKTYWRPLLQSNGSPAIGFCSNPASTEAPYLAHRLEEPSLTLEDCFDFCSSTAECKYAAFDHKLKGFSCIAYSSCDPQNMNQDPNFYGSQWRTYALEANGLGRRLLASHVGASVLV